MHWLPSKRKYLHVATGWFLFFSFVVAMLAGLLFTPGLPGDFVFDDIPNIVNNEAIQLTQLDVGGLFKVIAAPQMSGHTRVLPTLTFALDFWRAGEADPAAFKTTNIIIHAVTACALAWLFRSLLLIVGVAENRARWWALALAFAWAAHPLQVSSVLYAVQRLQTMGTLFLVLTLLAYLKARQAQIEGRPARSNALVTALLWALALGCKEDSVQLPIYTLALELTVLRFHAADLRTTSLLRSSYLIATLAAAVIYFFWVVPHHWSWDAYGGRDFSTPERLLTQARVLCLYLWQILAPLPQHMPFYYDWLQPSRGLLQPWTTLPAITVILALLGAAWRLRSRWPLFSLGVFLFFGAHFITSNVIGLELAFEHRNHFALIGAVLATGSLLGCASRYLRIQRSAQFGLCALLLLVLGSATIQRARSWNSELSLARTSTEIAPHSARAWISLCAGYYEAGGSAVQNNLFLNKAIDACRAGTASAPYALNNFALLVVLKTLRGDVTKKDWDNFQEHLSTVRMSWDNQRAPLILTYNLRQGVKLDKQELLKALATLEQRASLNSFKLASLGYFVMNDLGEPDLAMPYFMKAIEAAPINDPFPLQLSADLKAKGRADLAEKIELLGSTRGQATGWAQNRAK